MLLCFVVLSERLSIACTPNPLAPEKEFTGPQRVTIKEIKHLARPGFEEGAGCRREKQKYHNIEMYQVDSSGRRGSVASVTRIWALAGVGGRCAGIRSLAAVHKGGLVKGGLAICVLLSCCHC